MENIIVEEGGSVVVLPKTETPAEWVNSSCW